MLTTWGTLLSWCILAQSRGLWNMHNSDALVCMQIGSPVCIRAYSIAPAANETNYCSAVATTNPKDTCSSLAVQYSTTVDRLKQINPGLDCSQSSIGASLSICASAITAPTKADLTNYENPAR